jgi:hypothetical protein
VVPKKSPPPTRRDRLKTATGIVGLSLIGPALLSDWIARIIEGRFSRGHGGGLTSSENPFIFYAFAFLGLAVFVPAALASVMFAVGHILLRTSDSNPAHAKLRRLLIGLLGVLERLLRGWIALVPGSRRRSLAN